ncbi:allene oxide synthase 1, chloroplastic-like [Phragmites australis]|uniref:allene oxide synthase 1, chloroplastic-like n=1 Tax=Phragmites australis TaxID=29695 RepID=UPI002D783F12|nr:allene oxide synthase 1, chloroplastic-like [Phragmites australis]
MATATYLSFSALPSCARRARQTSAVASATDRHEVVSPKRRLPLRKVPGDYGPPVVGALRDRLEYFYGPGGRDGFFTSRVRAHQSTVVRLNMPPGPFVARDPRVVALLDAASFPVLFDTSLVDKTDLFTGTFMPSTDLTGGYRVLSYLDPAEPSHAPLKTLLFYLLSHRRQHVIPKFRDVYGDLFGLMENELSRVGKADFGHYNDAAAFSFLCQALLGRDPADSALLGDGPKLIVKWVLFQLSPLLNLGLPKLVEDSLLHSFRLPPALVKKDYDRLAGFFRDAARAVVDEGERLGIAREEAMHNILFAMCFNSFGGMKILFPSLVKWLGRAGARTHGQLATEVRNAVRENGGDVTMRALAEMPLVKSAVYEALRIEPPVPMQYGRAKRDMVVESHDYGYEVREGEMLFGYQPMATKDARVFARPEEYVPDRFLGEDGAHLLRHVVWSNGPETASPTLQDKQCAGKDFVVLIARLLVAELFLRYDSFDVQVGTSALGSSVTITSLKKATF